MYPDLDEFGSPFFLLLGTQNCWKCGSSCRVAGLVSDEAPEEGEEVLEPFMLNNIQAMPDEFLAAIRQIQPHYEFRASRMAGISYFVNTCTCGAHFGDHFLFAEPGGTFFPMDDEEAVAIEVYELPLAGTYKIECSAALGTGRSILNHGKWLKFPG